jgi:hypothetical protein
LREGLRIEIQVMREAFLPVILWYRNLLVSTLLVAAAAGGVYGLARLAIRLSSG